MALRVSVIDFLSGLTGNYNKIYFRPNSGNAGDSLINFGFYSAARKSGLNYQEILNDSELDKISSDDILILSGGGNLVPYWDAGSDLVRRLVKYDFPIALMPQSVVGRDDVLRLLRSKDTLFLREEISYEYALGLKLECQVLFDHDLAFHADLEFLNGFPLPVFSLKNFRKISYIAYHYLRSRIRPGLQVFRSDRESRLDLKKKRINDLSQVARFGTLGFDLNVCSAYWFLKVISWYDSIETDRLHVFIGGVLLGKKVILHENSYHKIRGVYKSSIADNDAFKNLVSFK